MWRRNIMTINVPKQPSEQQAPRFRRGAFSVFFQLQRNRVNAVSRSSGLRSVVKNVSKVGVATAALHLRALHAVTHVALRLDGLFAGWSVKTRPSGTGMIFCLGTK